MAIDAVFRFGIDFTRYYDSTSYLGRLGPLSFNINQILSAILFITALVMLRVLSRRPAPSAAATGPEPGDETAASALGTQAG